MRQTTAVAMSTSAAARMGVLLVPLASGCASSNISCRPLLLQVDATEFSKLTNVVKKDQIEDEEPYSKAKKAAAEKVRGEAASVW